MSICNHCESATTTLDSHGVCIDSKACTIRRVCSVTQSPSDPVSKPAHYTGGVLECIDAVTEAAKGLSGAEAFCLGNAMKYLWRHDKKNGNEDLSKAIWYIERLKSERKKRGAE